MKLVLQRVANAGVYIEGQTVAKISQGLLIFFGVEKQDNSDKVNYLADKALKLRIFQDDKGKMNLSCLDVSGDVLVISQFTLAGDCTKGKRPSFDNAAQPKEAKFLYRQFIEKVAESGLTVKEGQFGANMQVELVNDGPVTFFLSR
ncbi:MAG: D-tyrosyl-tRNA(Tyr) deacylase [Nitrospina sp.]|nr:D-tyrosyl-tRNA(Tyr) deacylase [Nitrospina sp.]|tara:strand:+ start:1971 stop:2408 length:438 start_codon:yes stop_codon:yes gene_type:complete